jgi:hypothetical protein
VGIFLRAVVPRVRERESDVMSWDRKKETTGSYMMDRVGRSGAKSRWKVEVQPETWTGHRSDL